MLRMKRYRWSKLQAARMFNAGEMLGHEERSYGQHTRGRNSAPDSPPCVGPPRKLARAGHDQLLIWLERSRQRQHLAMLSDHMLKDIGMTRADVEAEVSKPFWEA